MPTATARRAQLDLTETEYLFVDALVGAMTGYTVAELPEEDLDLVGQCVDAYYAYIEDYFAQHFEKRDYLKLKAVEKYSKPSLEEEPELAKKYLEAYRSFLAIAKGQA